MSADFVTVEMPKGTAFVIDAADFEAVHVVTFRDGFVWGGRICDWPWKPLKKKNTTYATKVIKQRALLRELRLHRLVMDAGPAVVVDHIDGDGLNCRRSNLRLTDAVGNARNRRASDGRYKGVTFHRQTGRWTAQIRVAGIKKHLGLFGKPEDAAKAYDVAALEAFGEFACINFPACEVSHALA